MRRAIDRYAPEHDAEVSRVPRREFDVGSAEGSQPPRRVSPWEAGSSLHGLCHCTETFLGHRRKQRVLVPEVPVGRGLRDPGALRGPPERQRIGPRLVDQGQRCGSKRFREISMVIPRPSPSAASPRSPSPVPSSHAPPAAQYRRSELTPSTLDVNAVTIGSHREAAHGTGRRPIAHRGGAGRDGAWRVVDASDAQQPAARGAGDHRRAAGVGRGPFAVGPRRIRAPRGAVAAGGPGLC
jgi:hypothetical protein